MGFVSFIFVIVVIFFVVGCVSSGNKGSSPVYYGGGFSSGYDEEDDETFVENELDDYADYETEAARGDRDYFSDDPAQDYNSYYAQIADDAMMGDEGSIEEMMGEF